MEHLLPHLQGLSHYKVIYLKLQNNAACEHNTKFICVQRQESYGPMSLIALVLVTFAKGI